jgi:hypothetical protein
MAHPKRNNIKPVICLPAGKGKGTGENVINKIP